MKNCGKMTKVCANDQKKKDISNTVCSGIKYGQIL